MANTYFKLKTEKDQILTLTAFVGPSKDKEGNPQSGRHIQLSIGSAFGQYVSLNESEARKLVFGLLERLDGNVTATGTELTSLSDCNPD